MASHSSAYALAPHPRNIPDEVIERIAADGGVIMVNFYPPFLRHDLVAGSIALYAESRTLMVELRDELAVEEELQRRHGRVKDTGDVGDVVDHIEHIARIGGIDCVGLGSDFDGVDLVPDGLEDVSCYPNITEELLRRDWTEPDVRKVLGDNALRVLEAAEDAAG
jgi:membrane dipeptidase